MLSWLSSLGKENRIHGIIALGLIGYAHACLNATVGISMSGHNYNSGRSNTQPKMAMHRAGSHARFPAVPTKALQQT